MGVWCGAFRQNSARTCARVPHTSPPQWQRPAGDLQAMQWGWSDRAQSSRHPRSLNQSRGNLGLPAVSRRRFFGNWMRTTGNDHDGIKEAWRAARGGQGTVRPRAACCLGAEAVMAGANAKACSARRLALNVGSVDLALLRAFQFLHQEPNRLIAPINGRCSVCGHCFHERADVIDLLLG